MAQKQYPIEHLFFGEISKSNTNLQIFWVNLNQKYEDGNIQHFFSI